MTIAEMFEKFISNIAINNGDQISDRYEQITRCLNAKYRDTESKTANSLQVGSYGRNTAIRGISDLDMIYMMPKSEWDRFKENRQSALLQEVKGVLKERYPATDIRADGQVVVVSFGNQDVEVVPAFEQDDGSFKYPDTNDGGTWKITKPRDEIKAISTVDIEKNFNLKKLCKMTRAWKNKHGVVMGGLLIDTLSHNFLKSTAYYDDKSHHYFDFMVRDFFKYLSELSEQDYYLAPGSYQHVHVKNKFQKKAKKAHELCLKAIEAEDNENVNNKWKKVFGRPFPAAKTSVSKASAEHSSITWNDTEEFIEDRYEVDIRYSIEIDCDVSQNGYRESSLRRLLHEKLPLLPQKKLIFRVIESDVPHPHSLMWKVLNRGDIAKQKNQIRGQIISDNGHSQREEQTTFKGEHIVECYAVRNGVVVAKSRIDVPIQ